MSQVFYNFTENTLNLPVVASDIDSSRAVCGFILQIRSVINRSVIELIWNTRGEILYRPGNVPNLTGQTYTL